MGSRADGADDRSAHRRGGLRGRGRALEGDDGKLEDELGDLLFQTYFLALLLQERGAGSLESVARRIEEKLVRRHPHVFGEVEAETPGRVRANWEQIKAEQEGREGIFHHVPETLPALLYAQAQRRAAAIDFEYPDVDGALGDLDDELRELREAIAEVGEPAPEAEADSHVFEELGDVLFAAVNVARRLNVDPGSRCGRGKAFADRVERASTLAEAEARAPRSIDEKDRYFDAAKEERLDRPHPPSP